MTSRIQEILGEPLSAVAFVQDYIEFHFDGKIVRALAHPLLQKGRMLDEFPNSGSRDAFCGLISSEVKSVTIEERESIKIEFLTGEVIAIPLTASDASGPEAAHYVPGEDQPIEVWSIEPVR